MNWGSSCAAVFPLFTILESFAGDRDKCEPLLGST